MNNNHDYITKIIVYSLYNTKTEEYEISCSFHALFHVCSWNHRDKLLWKRVSGLYILASSCTMRGPEKLSFLIESSCVHNNTLYGFRVFVN